jgi:hypothetical protein
LSRYACTTCAKVSGDAWITRTKADGGGGGGGGGGVVTTAVCVVDGDEAQAARANGRIHTSERQEGEGGTAREDATVAPPRSSTSSRDGG